MACHSQAQHVPECSASSLRDLWLLAGTPVQNNMRELHGIMSLLDQEEYKDAAEFAEKYGGDDEPPTVVQIQALQVDLYTADRA